MKSNEAQNLKEQLKDWTLMPPKKGTCSECGVNHPPEAPHNKDSMFYQYKFAKENGRWPSWDDASAHCTDEVKEILKIILIKQGIIKPSKVE